MQKIGFLFLLGFALIFAGCDETPQPKTTAVDLPQVSTGAQAQDLGSDIRVKFISGEKERKPFSPGKTHIEIQEAVQGQVEGFVNSGQYEVIRVVTTRCGEGHLLSAEVYYRTKKPEK